MNWNWDRSSSLTLSHGLRDQSYRIPCVSFYQSSLFIHAPPKRAVGPDNSPWAGYRSPRLPTLTGAPSLIALWLETIYVAVVVLHVYVSLASTCSRVMLFPGCHGGVMRYVGPPLFDRVIVTDSGTGNFSFKFSLVSTQETHSLRLQRVLHYL